MFQDIVDRLDFSTGWWYPVVLGCVLLGFVLVMPKRLGWRQMYLTFGLIVGIVWCVDTVFAVWLDLFDIGSKTTRGISEFFLYSVIPPCFAVIYLNYYNDRSRLLYTVLFTAMSGLAEWTAVSVGVMKLIHWNTLFSIPVYIVVYAFFLPAHLRIMERASREVMKTYPH